MRPFFMLVVVGGVFEDLVGAVKLFGTDEIGKAVREDERRKTPEKIGFFSDFRGKAVGAADNNSQLLPYCEDFLEFVSEFGRTQHLATLVAENNEVTTGKRPTL